MIRCIQVAVGITGFTLKVAERVVPSPVSNFVLDLIFGPADEFEYESTTRPGAHESFT